VDLGLGQVRHEGSNQHGRLSLADKGSRSGHNGFGTRDAQGPVEEVGKLDDEPLQNARVVEQRDEGDEEDDGRDDAGEEPGHRGDGIVKQESHTLVGESEQRASQERDKGKDIVAYLRAQDKDGYDELRQHTANDGVPRDLGPVHRGGVKSDKHDNKSKDGYGAGSARVLTGLLGDEAANQEDNDGDGGGERLVEFLRGQLVGLESGTVVDEADGSPEEGHWHPEGEHAQRNGEPEQEWDQPSQTFGHAKDGDADYTHDPPAIFRRKKTS
jgi:hypothetical protein